MKDYPFVVVTPVYEDVEASGRLFRELARLFPGKIHVVAVDDGSVRQPLGLQALRDAGLAGTVIRLRRNVGHQRAIAIGLSYVADHMHAGQRVVVMDSDGEDLPESIPVLLHTLNPDTVDVVVARRKNRVDSLGFRMFYWVYRLIFALLAGHSIRFGNFMALGYSAVQRLTSMPELSIHVAGAVLASKLRATARDLDRGPRYAGQSKMNFVGLALHGFKALMVFAEDVLVRIGIACTIVGGLSLLGAVTIVTLKLLGYGIPGWASILTGIMVLIFLQTGTLTLLSLMLTGLTRRRSVIPGSYRDLVADISDA